MDYTVSTVGCRAEGLSAIWSVDREPIGRFLYEGDPQFYYTHSELQITNVLKMFELFLFLL